MNVSLRTGRLLAIAACSLFFLGTAHAAEAKPGEPSQFEIAAWGGAPGSAQELKRIRECGFTIAGTVSPSQLGLVQAAGLRALVWPDDADMEKTIKDKRISEHPALAGFLVGSEPSSKAFPKLGSFIDLVKKNAPSKIALMNLFPHRANADQLQAASYKEYLDKWVTVGKPPVLCYDEYAFMEDGTMNTSYYDSLEAVRAKALENRIPFWNVIQGAGHLFFREPSAADVLFQCYSSAAYGARGIVYFTYKSYPFGNYRGAAVDQYGNETAAWQYFSNANHQLLSMASYLMKLTSNEVYHFGNVPPAGRGPSANALLTGVGDNMLVGDFTHEDGSRWALVVNKDLNKSAQFWPKYRAPFTGSDKVAVFRGGQLVTLDGNYEEHFLSPGQGVLLKLKMR